MADLRQQLCRRILQAPLHVLEGLGKHKLFARNFDDDVNTITNTLTTLPLLCMHIAIVISSFVYLAWLSWPLFIGVAFSYSWQFFAYQLPAIRAMQYFRKQREEYDVLNKHFRAVTDGTKELKLHFNRREAFFSKLLQPTLKSLARNEVTGNTIFEAASSWGHLLFFVLIGLLLFAWPNFAATTTETLTGYVLTLLYIITPLQVVLGRLPHLSRTSIALKRIEKLGFSLTEQPHREGLVVPAKRCRIGRVLNSPVSHIPITWKRRIEAS